MASSMFIEEVIKSETANGTTVTLAKMKGLPWSYEVNVEVARDSGTKEVLSINAASFKEAVELYFKLMASIVLT